MKNEQPILSASAITLIQNNGIDFSSAKKYPVDVLSEKELDKLPADVNPSIKEVGYSFNVAITKLEMFITFRKFIKNYRVVKSSFESFYIIGTLERG